MNADVHAHTSYSDGGEIPLMLRAAVDPGLDAVGFTDHCSLSETWREERLLWNRNFDRTYERRREALAIAERRYDVRTYDAVEMDYEPGLERRIESFLDCAGFDYAIGSVHDLDGANVHARSHFAGKPKAERRDLVDRYFEKLVALIDSELFTIAAHPDLVERNPHLRGFATVEQYERVADAFTDSRTVPEINAGRLLDDYGEFHPSPVFLDVLTAHDVSMTVGTDSHEPDAIAPRATAIEREFDARGIEVAEVTDIVDAA